MHALRPWPLAVACIARATTLRRLLRELPPRRYIHHHARVARLPGSSRAAPRTRAGLLFHCLHARGAPRWSARGPQTQPTVCAYDLLVPLLAPPAAAADVPLVSIRRHRAHCRGGRDRCCQKGVVGPPPVLVRACRRARRLELTSNRNRAVNILFNDTLLAQTTK